MTGTRLGAVRAYWLGVVVCMGGFLYGYDSGIIGGVLTLSSFEHDFRYSTKQATRTSSLAVSLQQLGAFVACFAIWPITAVLGRRVSLMLCSTIFCIGVIIETVNTHSLPAFYVGRVIAGLGLGGATVVIPMYSSEMSPAHLRGQIGCFFQLFFTIGILISYWVDYGVEQRVGKISKQWQIPVGLQLVPGALLGLGMLTLKESVRWHVKRGEMQKAWQSLVWIRASDDQAVKDEFEEIKAGVDLELRATEGFRLSELVQKDNFSRIFTAFWIFTAQQATGATAFAYYGPQYFKALVNGSTSQNLLLTGIFGAVKVVACASFVFFLAERVERRTALIFGAAFMAACHITVAAVVKTLPPPGNGDITSSGIATVALIYLFVIAYNMSWGALPWPYVSEIFPTRIREPGIGVGVAAQWLFAFVFTIATPYMINNLKWGTFLLWGLFNVGIAILSYFFIKNTKGKTLEEINAELVGDEGLLHAKLQAVDTQGAGSDTISDEETVQSKGISTSVDRV